MKVRPTLNGLSSSSTKSGFISSRFRRSVQGSLAPPFAPNQSNIGFYITGKSIYFIFFAFKFKEIL